MFVEVERADLAEDLWEYGEDGLANRALKLSDLELARVGVLAGRILLSDEYATSSGASPMLGKACALAAVQLLEARKRPLARQRRRIRERDERESLLPEDWVPPPADEDPRGVFIATCAAVASAFEDRGFRFAKSGPHMSKQADSFRFVVSFQWWYYSLEAAGHVHSRPLRAWRKKHETPGDDYLAAGNLGNLRRDESWLDWDLTARDKREERVAQILAAIEDIALPYFAQFEDESHLVELLEAGGFPGCEGLEAVEWLLATDRARSALRHGREALMKYPWAPGRYEREVKRYRKEGTGRGPYTGLVEGLAYATVALGLDFLELSHRRQSAPTTP